MWVTSHLARLEPGPGSIILQNIEVHTDLLWASGIGPSFSKKNKTQKPTTKKQKCPIATLFGFGFINCEISFKSLVKWQLLSEASLNAWLRIVPHTQCLLSAQHDFFLPSTDFCLLACCIICLFICVLTAQGSIQSVKGGILEGFVHFSCPEHKIVPGP